MFRKTYEFSQSVFTAAFSVEQAFFVFLFLPFLEKIFNRHYEKIKNMSKQILKDIDYRMQIKYTSIVWQFWMKLLNLCP